MTEPTRLDAGASEDEGISFDEAFDQARMAHRVAYNNERREELERVEILYHRLLEASPDHPSVLHYLGILLHQTGRSEEGQKLLHRSLELAPEQADTWANYGNVLRQNGRLPEALNAYRKALEYSPKHTEVFCNVGFLHLRAGKFADARDLFQQALEINPTHTDSHRGLADALFELGEHAESIAHGRAALAFDPTNADSLWVLALILRNAGYHEDAIKVLEDYKTRRPDDPAPDHIMAAWSQASVPERASDSYVKSTFDRMANTFDYLLWSLDYRAPGLAVEAVGRLREPKQDLDILDAGCGTGLCGSGLRPYARSLTGVDLSRGMLEKALQRKTYDRLFEAELMEFCNGEAGCFDVITCVDTLCYFGNLVAPMKSFVRALRPGGHVVFSVERRGDGQFHLEEHGRYAHNEAYVRASAAEAGLQVLSIDVQVLRKERSEPVSGLVVSLRKPLTTTDVSTGAAT